MNEPGIFPSDPTTLMNEPAMLVSGPATLMNDSVTFMNDRGMLPDDPTTFMNSDFLGGVEFNHFRPAESSEFTTIPRL
jgi:hypothetical protein